MRDENAVYSKIVINNVRREKNLLSRCACRSNKGIRKHPEWEPVPDRINIRPIFFHDTDRIMHSFSYSRYIDKTQVFYLFENDHVTHLIWDNAYSTSRNLLFKPSEYISILAWGVSGNFRNSFVLAPSICDSSVGNSRNLYPAVILVILNVTL